MKLILWAVFCVVHGTVHTLDASDVTTAQVSCYHMECNISHEIIDTIIIMKKYSETKIHASFPTCTVLQCVKVYIYVCVGLPTTTSNKYKT